LEFGLEESGKSEGVVLADVGGTNVRFAVCRNGILGSIEHMAVADYRLFADALGSFMARQSDPSAIRHALFGVAGVVEGERCALTNNPWIGDVLSYDTSMSNSGSAPGGTGRRQRQLPHNIQRTCPRRRKAPSTSPWSRIWD
jgi:hypothetical protein